MTITAPLLQDVLERIRADYLEMPGMRLRPEQVQRLCGVDSSVCRQVLDLLVQTKFLCVRRDGTYARLTDGSPSRWLPRRPG
jgi:DNA-binding GntR family transcriptional regulator